MNLPLCTKCNKRPAVVFVTKFENGSAKNEGYCLLCAKELNISQVDEMIKKMNLISFHLFLQTTVYIHITAVSASKSLCIISERRLPVTAKIMNKVILLLTEKELILFEKASLISFIFSPIPQ